MAASAYQNTPADMPPVASNTLRHLSFFDTTLTAEDAFLATESKAILLQYPRLAARSRYMLQLAVVGKENLQTKHPMSYSVKEIYFTLQGEGAHSGRPAVFCRFTGCNLWNGHEKDRKSAICSFCDTDFLGTDGPGGGFFESSAILAQAVDSHWPKEISGKKYVVCTGGEPLLQLDSDLIDALHAEGFEIGVETNGTISAPEGIDWICVSPKAGAELVLTQGNELKLVFPQQGAEPNRYAELEFEHFFLQPMDGPDREKNTKLAIEFCLTHPHWKLSVQIQKILGLP